MMSKLIIFHFIFLLLVPVTIAQQTQPGGVITNAAPAASPSAVVNTQGSSPTTPIAPPVAAAATTALVEKSAVVIADTHAKSSAAVPPEKAQPLRIPRFDAAPVIDGKLDDAIWRQAVVLKDFYQINPGDNIAPTAPTELLIGYERASLTPSGFFRRMLTLASPTSMATSV